MKTQYRYPATMSGYATIQHLHADRARWKRKNRIKQLKSTIERLTYENRIFKETFMQNRAFLKELLTICKRPNSSTLHRLTDVYQQLSMQLMSLKNYDRKEQNNG